MVRGESPDIPIEIVLGKDGFNKCACFISPRIGSAVRTLITTTTIAANGSPAIISPLEAVLKTNRQLFEFATNGFNGLEGNSLTHTQNVESMEASTRKGAY